MAGLYCRQREVPALLVIVSSHEKLVSHEFVPEPFVMVGRFLQRRFEYLDSRF